jgi:ABC-type lipopolysaccharide export system ATPase subunit
MMHILEADSIQLEFDGRKILSDVYLRLETGKITGLLGRNGQGKSCLMKMIYGSLKGEKSVRFDGIAQSGAFTKPGILMYLPQFNFIPRVLSLKKIFKDFSLDFSLFEKMFPVFGPRYKSSFGNLSGGEHRIVELYVIIKSGSHFALLDEPFTHLNPLQIETVKEWLVMEKACKGFLITDHMYTHITGICDDLYILANGKTHPVKNPTDIETLGYARL